MNIRYEYIVFRISKGINRDYSPISNCIERLLSTDCPHSEIKIDKLNRVQRVSVTVERREALVTFRNMDGTMKVRVPQLERKIKLKDLIEKISETKELQKNTEKANSFRKTVCDILRYLLSVTNISFTFLYFSAKVP